MTTRAEYAAQQRRQSQREEFAMQSEFAALLSEYVDPAAVRHTSLENRPLSRLSGYLQKKRGVRAGLPDVLVLVKRTHNRTSVITVELKSRRGVLSKVQRQIAAEWEAVGAKCWVARSPSAALTALYRSRVPFRRQWTPPRLAKWEGPFRACAKRLPQHPRVAAERRAARKRWLARQQAQQVPAIHERQHA